jgi:hypothetical protein
VLVGKSHEAKFRLNTSNFAKGIYILEIQSGTDVERQIILKQ